MSKWGKVFLILFLMFFLSFSVIWFLAKGWVPYLWVAVALMVGSLAGAVAVDRIFYSEFFTLKTTKSGMSMGMMILLSLVLLGAVNFMAAQKVKTFDFSQAQLNSLSDQSIKVVKSLKEDLIVNYFYKKGSEGIDQRKAVFIELIQKYQDQSSKIKLEFVDMNSRPDLTAKYKISSGVEAVVLDYQGKDSRIEKIEEQELTSAIVKVTKDVTRNIYISQGQGELPLEASPDGQSISELKKSLEGNRYNVRPFQLSQTIEIPKDADMFVVVSPKQDFLETKRQSLEDYLKNGGSLVLVLDPKTRHGLDPLLKKVGVQVENNFVITAVNQLGTYRLEPRIVQGNVFSGHQITKPFAKEDSTYFSLPQALKKSQIVEGVSVDEFVKANSQSMAFTELKFDKPGPVGPFTLAMVIKGQWPESKAGKEFNLVLLGSSSFISDQLFHQGLNRDLALNSFAFLSKEENLISISPKEVGRTNMLLTQSSWTIIIFGLLLPIPILLFLASGVTWYRRRNA